MAFQYTPAQTVLQVGTHSLHAVWARSFVRLPGEERALPYGSVLWPSALALLHGMITVPPSWAGARVVEMGCGVGLCGVLAARLGARVTVADNHDDMEHFVTENASLNGVEVAWRHWDHSQELSGLDDVNILLGSDVLYSAGQLNAVLNTLEQRVTAGRMALLSDPGRRSLWTLMEKLRARGFSVEHRPLTVDASLFEGAADVLACHPPPTGPCHVLVVRR